MAGISWILGPLAVLLIGLGASIAAANALDTDIQRVYEENKYSDVPPERERLPRPSFLALAIIPPVGCALLALIARLGIVAAIIVTIIAVALIATCGVAMFNTLNNAQANMMAELTACPAVLLAISVAYIGGNSANGWRFFFIGIILGCLSVILLWGLRAYRVPKKNSESQKSRRVRDHYDDRVRHDDRDRYDDYDDRADSRARTSNFDDVEVFETNWVDENY